MNVLKQNTDSGITSATGMALMIILGLAVAVLVVSILFLIPIAVANSINLIPYTTEIVVGSGTIIISMYLIVNIYGYYYSEADDLLKLSKYTKDDGTTIFTAEVDNPYDYIDFTPNETLIVAPIGEDPRNWDLETILSEQNSIEFCVDPDATIDDEDIYQPGEIYSEKNASFSESNGIVVYDNTYTEIDRIEN